MFLADECDSESPASSKVKSTIRKCERITSSGTLSSNNSSCPSESDEGSKKLHSKPAIISKEKHSKTTVSSVGHASDKVKTGNTINRTPDKSGSSSDSDSSSEESDAQPKLIAKHISSPSSSSSSSEDSDSEPLPNLKKGDAVNASTAKTVPASTYSNSKPKVGKGTPFPTSSVQNPKIRVTKKRRMDAEGHSVVTAHAIVDDKIPAQKVREQSHITGKTGNDPQTTINRFTRVNSSKIQPTVDNSYVSKVCCFCSVFRQFDIVCIECTHERLW
jgi:hypothetical protein